MIFRSVAACFTAALLAFVTPAAAQQLQGEYTLAGETGDGAPYQGSIAIAARDQAYDVTWTRISSLPRRGFALKLDNVLGVAAEDGDEDFGIVLYRVKGGHLEGIWQGSLNPRVLSLGREDLDGPDSLEGNFAISVGLNPDGSQYHGNVTMHRTGRVYAVTWYTPELRYTGTGVMVGDVFVVGYSAHFQSAVAAYCLRSTKLVEGVTARANESAIGAEQFWSADSAPPSPDRLAALRGSDGIFGCGGPIVLRQSLPTVRAAYAALDRPAAAP